MDNNLQMAKIIAREAHKGQKRLDGKDYITHPEAVANMFKNEDYKVVAWLHDVLEDSDLQPENLAERGIPRNLIQSIVYLTRLPKENYKNYILKVTEDEIATKVKIADLKHNISTLKEGSMKDKYLLALYILQNG